MTFGNVDRQQAEMEQDAASWFANLALFGIRCGLAVAMAFCVLVCVLAVAAAAHCDEPTPACHGSLSLWTPAEHSTQTHSWLQPAARAEAICTLKGSVRGWARGDLYALPGKQAPTDGTLTNVGAGEVWGGVSRPIAGPLSLAAFTGIHGALGADGMLAGGVSSSFCGGARLDYGADYSVFGVCSAYKPAGNGVAVVGTVVLPVKGVVGIAANFAWVPKTGDRIIAVGPTASWGK